MRAAGLGLILLLASFHAFALRPLSPGKPVELAPDEGLLAVAFDTDIPIDSAVFKNADRAFTHGVLSKLPVGRTIALYAVPAGRYRWGRMTFRSGSVNYFYLDPGKDPEYAFEVKPGQLSYAGDLVFRSESMSQHSVRLVDRALPTLDWLAEKHPQTMARYGFVYNGTFPDPFPVFYNDVRTHAKSVVADLNAGQTAPDPGALPLEPERLWKTSGVRDYALSPDGSFVVLEIAGIRSSSTLELIDLANGTSQKLLSSVSGFSTVTWESDGILIAGKEEGSEESLTIVKVGEFKNGRRDATYLYTRPGTIVDMTPERPGQIVFEWFDRSGKLVVHEIPLRDQKSIDTVVGSAYSARMNKALEGDHSWLMDGHGALRVAMVRRGDDMVLMHGAGRDFREVMRFDSDNEFEPYMLSYDGDLIYGLTDADRAQRDFVAFDPNTRTMKKTLFSRPGVDVVAPLFDDRRNPIGVRYYESGRLVSEYFDSIQKAQDAELQRSFPGRMAIPLQRSADGSRAVVWVDASDAPPQLYFVDFARRRADVLDDYYPDLSGKSFAHSESLKIRSSDGLTIDAFLTLPVASGKRPLVVMPHGGPIGVADSRHFDPEVQLLASLGYAVLQVNFRGSEGYGKAFREAGHGQYGTGIEDDIDAAIREVLSRYPLDEHRMCVVGASYGGYSALVSAIRWPERFKCVVSIAGVTDRLLAFNATDAAATAEGRKMLVELMGDPRQNEQRFKDVSPVYQYKRLNTPVMLVHGNEDMRVDFEHTRRLVRLLDLDGRPPVLMAIPDEGHGFSTKWNVTVWRAVAGFLRQYLDANPPLPAKGAERAKLPTETGSP